MSLREQLQAIYDEHGKLTPALVVETARPKGHPLHARVFDRTQREAAEAWYLDRAHGLIVSVKVVYKEAREDSTEKRVRAFHAVQATGPDEFTYEPVERVAGDEFTRQLVLRNMEREWKQLRHRYDEFEEFVALVSADLDSIAA